MSTEERNKEAAIVAKAVSQIADELQRNGLHLNGEYISILKGIAFIIQKKGGEGCFKLQQAICNLLEKEYGLPAGAESDEVTAALQSL